MRTNPSNLGLISGINLRECKCFIKNKDSHNYSKEQSVFEPSTNNEHLNVEQLPKLDSKCHSTFDEDDCIDKSSSSDSLRNSYISIPLSTSKL